MSLGREVDVSVAGRKGGVSVIEGGGVSAS